MEIYYETTIEKSGKIGGVELHRENLRQTGRFVKLS